MRKLTLVASALAAMLLIAVPVGVAATPQQIYRDYADNGRLDGHYTKPELKRALKDAVVQGYGGPNGQNLGPTIKNGTGSGGQSGQSGGSQGGSAGVSTPPVKSTGGLPFTGLDLALISVGGVLLLAFGASLRRFARRPELS